MLIPPTFAGGRYSSPRRETVPVTPFLLRMAVTTPKDAHRISAGLPLPTSLLRTVVHRFAEFWMGRRSATPRGSLRRIFTTNSPSTSLLNGLVHFHYPYFTLNITPSKHKPAQASPAHLHSTGRRQITSAAGECMIETLRTPMESLPRRQARCIFRLFFSIWSPGTESTCRKPDDSVAKDPTVRTAVIPRP